jgi:hypothetical protein
VIFSVVARSAAERLDPKSGKNDGKAAEFRHFRVLRDNRDAAQGADAPRQGLPSGHRSRCGKASVGPIQGAALPSRASRLEIILRRGSALQGNKANGRSVMNDGMAAPAPILREVSRTAVPTRLGAVPRRPIVMVLGMHRSGTSLCSHVLSALGLDMTDRVPGPGQDSPGEDNPLGHWERWEIVEFHDRILRFFNREFFSQAHDFALPVAWWAQPEVAQVRREITAFLERRMGSGYFGFKDPRTVRLMPMWHQIIGELKLAPKIVFCLRNPAQVARSLNGRDGFNLDTGEYRWFSYTVDFFRYTKSAEICTIESEDWFNDPTPNLTKLRNFLDLREDRTEFNLDLTVSDLVHHELRHDDPRLSEASQPLIRSVYKLARRADHDSAARAQLQTLAAQFVTFQQLQGAFQRDFEQVAAGAAKLSLLEPEAAALRASLEERDAQIETVRGEAQASAAQTAEALAEIERQRAQIAELVGGRDAAVMALEAVRSEAQAGAVGMAEIERQRAQLADLLRERDEIAVALDAARAEVEARGGSRLDNDGRVTELGEALGNRTAAADAMEAELAALREALAAAEHRVRESEASPAGLWAQLEDLRNAVAQAEWEAGERSAAVTMMQSEIGEIHQALLDAQERVVEGETTAAALHREIAGLRDALARAEQQVWERAGLVETMRAELLSLREALVQPWREAQEGVADIARLESELSGLRETVTGAQRDAEQSAAATKLLKGELAAAENALVAARQVGRAAINALAIDNPAPLDRLPQLGWRQTIRRWFGLAASA